MKTGKIKTKTEDRTMTWIGMLLVWNIALMGIGVFYLYRISITMPSLEEIENACQQ